jgi:serine/threonine protein kinase
VPSQPENILIDSECNIKIADFSLANTAGADAFNETSCGSPNYAAPEIITGQVSLCVSDTLRSQRRVEMNPRK